MYLWLMAVWPFGYELHAVHWLKDCGFAVCGLVSDAAAPNCTCNRHYEHALIIMTVTYTDYIPSLIQVWLEPQPSHQARNYRIIKNKPAGPMMAVSSLHRTPTAQHPIF